MSLVVVLLSSGDEKYPLQVLYSFVVFSSLSVNGLLHGRSSPFFLFCISLAYFSYGNVSIYLHSDLQSMCDLIRQGECSSSSFQWWYCSGFIKLKEYFPVLPFYLMINSQIFFLALHLDDSIYKVVQLNWD